MKYWLLILTAGILRVQAQSLTSFVNPFIGTGGHGHTFPGATLPFGAVQLSPDTRPDGYNDWDGCSGYHYSDSILYGFSHTHLSGTGVADYCDVLLMPTVGEIQLNNISGTDTRTGYASRFSHANEKASPGYYSVLLEDDGILAELTATLRTGLHAYHFPKTQEANIILDLTHRDKLLDGTFIEIISPTRIQGLRRSSSWARDQWVYFAIEFSQPFQYAGIVNGNDKIQTSAIGFRSQILSGTALKSYFRFATDGSKPLLVKCGISAVSCAGAWNNLQTENPGWDLKAIRDQASNTWDEALRAIQIESPADDAKPLNDPDNRKVIFYTALYHCMLAPNLYEDADGRFRTMGGSIMYDSGSGITPRHTQYTVFSLWDTFRTLHPLFNIIQRDRTVDFIQTFLNQYTEGGRLPVWELSANETECMIGYHSVSVIADAAAKGIMGFDRQLALEAMMHSADTTLFGLEYYRRKGFIESNEEAESVSRTLEYAYDDWCIGTFASSMGYEQEAQRFLNRGYNFLHLMNAAGFAQPRTNGGWYTPFDPFEVNFNYTEANSWQYSFFYPQYLPFIRSAEQKQKLEGQLDALFTAKAQTTGREQADITGLIGQYAHGNEPSHHIAYLYNYTGAPHKTQEKVQQICTSFYKNAPDGLIGNEDCGQMSAWYVMSAMGIYPVCPGTDRYALTTPLFNKITIATKTPFVISCDKDPLQSPYIQTAQLNGTPHPYSGISHTDIMKGGTLHFALQKTPSSDWGLDTGDPTLPQDVLPEIAPVIQAPSATFVGSMTIDIKGTPEQQVEYALNEGNWQTYTTPLVIQENTNIRARAWNPVSKKYSSIVSGNFVSIPKQFNIRYITQYNNQYTGGGALALIDGLHGNTDFRTGQWQGWWGEDMVIEIDLGEVRSIQEAGGAFLQDVRSWIWMPSAVEISVSKNGKSFTPAAMITHSIKNDQYDSKETAALSATFTPVNARYVRIRAVNFGPVPDWHPGKGGKTWIFCNEVWVR